MGAQLAGLCPYLNPSIMRFTLAFLLLLSTPIQGQLISFNLVPSVPVEPTGPGLNAQGTAAQGAGGSSGERPAQTVSAVDWSNQGLRRLPRAVDTLYWRPRIDLSRNKFRRLGRNSLRLNTDSLDLSENRMRLWAWSIPSHAFSRLIYLDLSDNRITLWNDDFLGGYIQDLNLSNNELQALSLPRVIAHPLQKLNVSGNSLTVLPWSVGHYGNLQTLDASRNQLDGIPTSIGKLTGLQELHLKGNNLTNTPSSIRKCTQLKLVDLRANPLDARAIAKLRRYLPADCVLLVDEPAKD